jgi:hypothetical protein
VKSYPLILTAAEVRAVLNGSKTQHRVRVKPQPVQVERYLHGRPTDSTDAASAVMRGPDGKGWACCGPFRCPFGMPGDTLYLRETTKRFTGCPVAGKPWPSDAPWVLSPDGDPYKALLHVVGNEEHVAALEYHAACVTVPSALMPRWASRITVINESVRVQRVQDISEEDARAEGMPSVFERFPGLGHDQRLTSGELMAEQPHRAAYAVAWDGRNGGACLWKSNPWVFALTFKRAENSR